MRYAKRTTVAPLKTRIEIEATVRKYGADQFAHADDTTRAMVQFRLTQPRALVVRFVLPLMGRRSDGKPAQLDEQRIRQRWRALLLNIKAKLEAVETGIEEIEQAFLAEIVLPDGRTMAEWAAPQMKQMLAEGRMPKTLMIESGVEDED